MTEQTAVHSPTPLERRQQLWLWFGVAAGPLIWAIHLVLAYALQSLSCQWQFLHTTILGMHGLRFTLLVITILAVLLIVYGGVVAYGFWRRFRSLEYGQGDGRREPERGRLPFMAYVGVAFSALFALVTLLMLTPILALDICG